MNHINEQKPIDLQKVYDKIKEKIGDRQPTLMERLALENIHAHIKSYSKNDNNR